LQGRKGPSGDGIFIAGFRWGCPFRTAERGGQWHVIWTGTARSRPGGWQDLPCSDRAEAAARALEAFEHWLTDPAQAAILEKARRELSGYNLICRCNLDYPFCHRTVLLRVVNESTRTEN
jgi:hypothetical protein